MSTTASARGGAATNPVPNNTDAVVTCCRIVISIGTPARISAARAGGSVQLVASTSRRSTPRSA